MHPLQKIPADSRRSRHEKGIHMTVRAEGGREGGRRVPAQSSAQYRVRGWGRSPRVCTRRCRVSGIGVPGCLQAIDSALRSLLRRAPRHRRPSPRNHANKRIDAHARAHTRAPATCNQMSGACAPGGRQRPSGPSPRPGRRRSSARGRGHSPARANASTSAPSPPPPPPRPPRQAVSVAAAAATSTPQRVSGHPRLSGI